MLNAEYSRWANVTLGLPCVVENTAYISYGANDEYIDIVSRYADHISICLRDLPTSF